MPDAPPDQNLPPDPPDRGRRLVSRRGDEAAQTLADNEQTIADSDQTGADLDQTSSDTDETASERDQHASDRDQEAADRDEAAGVSHGDEGTGANGYAGTRRARSQSSIERDLASQTRSQTSRLRDDVATRRDRMATERDEAARVRDELAVIADGEMERLELHQAGNGEAAAGSTDGRRVGDRKRAAEIRGRAAAQREAAARDREMAAEDRDQAARDRSVAAEELAAEGTDHLTGALRRRVGLAAVQREIDRTRRTGEHLAVAFVDVDGLKVANDEHGHAAGDEILREIARSITEHLRSYDVITRYGGDEFVCSLSGQDAKGADERFAQIRAHLSEASEASFTVGVAERGDDEALEELIIRADRAMMAARQTPNA